MNDCSPLKRQISLKYLNGLLFLLIIWGLNTTWALTAKTIDFKDLVSSADLVVYGTVQSQEIQAIYPNRPQMLFTLSTLKVEECWKGECGAQVEISQVGGTKGPFSVSLPGAPVLNKTKEHPGGVKRAA